MQVPISYLTFSTSPLNIVYTSVYCPMLVRSKYCNDFSSRICSDYQLYFSFKFRADHLRGFCPKVFVINQRPVSVSACLKLDFLFQAHTLLQKLYISYLFYHTMTVCPQINISKFLRATVWQATVDISLHERVRARTATAITIIMGRILSRSRRLNVGNTDIESLSKFRLNKEWTAQSVYKITLIMGMLFLEQSVDLSTWHLGDALKSFVPVLEILSL